MKGKDALKRPLAAVGAAARMPLSSHVKLSPPRRGPSAPHHGDASTNNTLKVVSVTLLSGALLRF